MDRIIINTEKKSSLLSKCYVGKNEIVLCNFMCKFFLSILMNKLRVFVLTNVVCDGNGMMLSSVSVSHQPSVNLSPPPEAVSQLSVSILSRGEHGAIWGEPAAKY